MMFDGVSHLADITKHLADLPAGMDEFGEKLDEIHSEIVDLKGLTLATTVLENVPRFTREAQDWADKYISDMIKPLRAKAEVL